MLEGKSISLLIFTTLNALGVGFLLYVLVQFWKEAHKSNRAKSRPNELSVHLVEQGVSLLSSPLAEKTRRENGRLIRFPVRAKGRQRRGDETVRHAVR